MNAAPAAPVCLAGPTAVGKTERAIELARTLNAEIICVDSGVVYRGMDIGTAKPNARQRAAVAHHLIDIREPCEAYSAAAFMADAKRLIAEIQARGRTPLLVGGTLLYFHVLREGLSALPGACAETRREIEVQAQRAGWPAMHRRLAEVDPESAAAIHPNHSSRLLRALEIYHLSGEAPSRLRGRRLAGPLSTLPRTRFVALMPTAERDAYHRRIETRLRLMFEAGLIAETRALMDGLSGPASRLAGYAQALAYLRGECDETKMRDDALIATRQLAKRQMSWVRAGEWQIVEIEHFDDSQTIQATLRRCLDA